jgi:hypothetical protein
MARRCSERERSKASPFDKSLKIGTKAMRYTAVSVNPAGQDTFQLHKHNCKDALKLQRSGSTLETIEAQSAAEAVQKYVTGELKELGYGDGDVRIMPCVARL